MAALQGKYETIIVLSMTLGEEGIASTIEKFKNLIAQNGTLGEIDEWGKRRLAYEINKENEGYYVLINFESPKEFPAELDRVYKITDGILRTLIVAKED